MAKIIKLVRISYKAKMAEGYATITEQFYLVIFIK